MMDSPSFFDRLLDGFFSLTHLWLAGWTAISFWSVVVEFCVRSVFIPAALPPFTAAPDRRVSFVQLGPAILVFVLWFVLKASWIGPLFHGRRLARKFRERSARSKAVMQCDEDSSAAVGRGDSVNPRFRRCGRCDSHLALGDRVYHCTDTGLHFPVYDHHCFWLRLTVFLHTIKPYLHVLAGLFLDSCFVLAVSVYTAVTGPENRLPIGVALASFCLLAFLGFRNIFDQWYFLAWRDATAPEQRKEVFHMVHCLNNEVRFVTVETPPVRVRIPLFPARKDAYHPWELSRCGNLREVLGRNVLSWFCFWIAPERVGRWDNDESDESDFRLGRLWTHSARVETAVYPHPAVLYQMELDESTPAELQTTILPSRQFDHRGARATGSEV